MSEKAKPKSNSDLKTQTKEEYKEVTLFRNPFIVISTTIALIYEQLMKLTNCLLTHKKIRFVSILILLACFVNGPHKQVKIFNISFLSNLQELNFEEKKFFQILYIKINNFFILKFQRLIKIKIVFAKIHKRFLLLLLLDRFRHCLINRVGNRIAYICFILRPTYSKSNFSSQRMFLFSSNVSKQMGI
jgi:hypothetical protein